jgi:hypothetical protein
MKLRKKQIYRVWLLSQDSNLNGGNHRFSLAIEGAKTREAAGRKACYIAWVRFGKVLADVHVEAIAPETVWY